MRLGGPAFLKEFSTDAFVASMQEAGYRAAYWPNAPEPAVDDLVTALNRADIIVAEVGAWSNPMDKDIVKRRKAIQFCIDQLALAERVGARCCVNIAGSTGDFWHGPCAADLTDSTFDIVVETTRTIIDAVKPRRTAYCLETMPWLFPSSPDEYLRLLQAIDRPGFGVHLDPVNLVNSPQRFFNNAALIRECFETLGSHIRSCHAKDIALSTKLTVHLDETPVGQGGLDYAVFLKELSRLNKDIPLMMEHMKENEYPSATAHIRAIAQTQGVCV